MRCADESKVGDIITAKGDQSVRQEEMDGFWEQNKGEVMEHKSAGFTTVHSRIFSFSPITWESSARNGRGR